MVGTSHGSQTCMRARVEFVRAVVLARLTEEQDVKQEARGAGGLAADWLLLLRKPARKLGSTCLSMHQNFPKTLLGGT